MQASIIIPSYNDGALLARCLDSLLSTRPEGDIEVVVALDGSTDGSPELLRRGMGDASAGGPLAGCVTPGAWTGLNLQVVELKQNAGRSAARNRAIEASSGEWLFFLDADLRVGPDWARSLREAQPDPEWVSVGEMVYVMDQDPELDARLFAGDPAAERLRLRGLKRYQRYLETRGPYKFRSRPEMPPRYFYTCNSCVHRGLMAQAGPFNEDYRAWGGEDIDMGLRLGAAGGRLRYCSQARALHAQERSFAAHCRNLEVMGRDSLPILVAEHPDMLQALQLDRLTPGGNGGRLLKVMRRIGLHRLLVALERAGNGTGFSERLYDLCVYLHYAGGFEDSTARREET